MLKIKTNLYKIYIQLCISQTNWDCRNIFDMKKICIMWDKNIIEIKKRGDV